MLFSCYFNMTAPCERAWRLRLRPGQALAVHKRMSMILNAPDGFPAVYRRFRPFGWRGRIQSCRRINHLAFQPFLSPFKNGENGENGIGGFRPGGKFCEVWEGSTLVARTQLRNRRAGSRGRWRGHPDPPAGATR